MKFHLPEYEVRHLERIKESVKHSLNGSEIVTIRKKRDLEFKYKIQTFPFYSHKWVRGKCHGKGLNAVKLYVLRN